MNKLTKRDKQAIGIGIGVAALGLLAVLFGIALWGAAIAALVWGIYDLVVVGFNGWALTWIILGSVGLLLLIIGAVKD